MSTDTSVPQPRVSGLGALDSALLDTLLREAPIGFAVFGTDLRFRRVNRTLARLHGLSPEDYPGRLPAEVWPAALAARAEAALGSVLSEEQPIFEGDQPVSEPAQPVPPARGAASGP